MSDKNAGLRSELTEIVNNAFKRASSAQQCALPAPSPFVEAIIGVVERYAAVVQKRRDAERHGFLAGWFACDRDANREDEADRAYVDWVRAKNVVQPTNRSLQ